MKQVSIRDLHQKTGYWVRLASRQPIVVTDRGRPVATLVGVTGLVDPAMLVEIEADAYVGESHR